MKILCCTLIALSSLVASGQVNRRMINKDSLTLTCLLNKSRIIEEPKAAYDIGEQELKLILQSEVDTSVKAPIDLTVTTIRRTEQGTYELVAHHQDYWLWFTGIERLKVVKGQKVARGAVLGIMETGKPLELLVYDFETPVDPKKYLRCPD